MPRLGIVTPAKAIPARSGVTLLARLLGNNRQPVQQADFTGVGASVKLWLRDLTICETVLDGVALTVDSVIFDNLQTDARWDLDTVVNPGDDGLTGYNFRTLIAASNFVNSPTRYRADVKFTPLPALGEPWVQSFEWPVFKTYAT